MTSCLVGAVIPTAEKTMIGKSCSFYADGNVFPDEKNKLILLAFSSTKPESQSSFTTSVRIIKNSLTHIITIKRYESRFVIVGQKAEKALASLALFPSENTLFIKHFAWLRLAPLIHAPFR